MADQWILDLEREREEMIKLEERVHSAVQYLKENAPDMLGEVMGKIYRKSRHGLRHIRSNGLDPLPHLQYKARELESAVDICSFKKKQEGAVRLEKNEIKTWCSGIVGYFFGKTT